MPAAPTRKTVDGRIDRAPCAHCGHPNDLSSIAEDLGGTGANSAFEAGSKWDCDHCHRPNWLVQVATVTMVRSRQAAPGEVWEQVLRQIKAGQ